MDINGGFKMTCDNHWNESDIIQTYIRQFDVITDYLEFEKLATFQESLTVMHLILEGVN